MSTQESQPVSEPSRLDPRTASLGFYWGGEYCVGRIYYWHDPDGVEPSIHDLDLRAQHPHISHEEWKKLFTEAFDRGERELLRQRLETEPDLFADPEKSQSAFIGYMFGPGHPSRETLEALGLATDEPTSEDA